MKNHIPSCPAATDPAAKCFCPPPGHPGTRYITGADPGTDAGNFELTPPVPVPETGFGGKPVNRSGETRSQTAARLRRQRAAFMIRKHGPGPAGRTCGACKWLEHHGGGRRAYAKCRKYGVSSSDATDWSKKWAPCGLYESR